jgi:hypothetical protein
MRTKFSQDVLIKKFFILLLNMTSVTSTDESATITQILFVSFIKEIDRDILGMYVLYEFLGVFVYI